MASSTLLQRLRQTNPWWFEDVAVGSAQPTPPRWTDRLHVDVSRWGEPNRAHLIVGPRQAGKSSLAWSVLRDLERPLFLNLEEHVFRGWCSSPAGFVSDLRGLGRTPQCLFLDEVQWLDQAALFVKGVIDLRLGFSLIVTGSSSFQFADRTRESLAGRATRNVLLPFSLAEVSNTDRPKGSAIKEARCREMLGRMLRVGGYPDVWLSDQPERVLGDLEQALILRDASDLFAIGRLDAYQKVLQLSARQIGQLVNVSEWASLSGVSSATVSRYLSLMEETQVVRVIPSFSRGKRREVTSARKVYFVDNGIRNSILGRIDLDPENDPDRGPLRENWVFTELLKHLPWHSPIRYWRSLSGAEVDFVIETPQQLVAIEVKATSLSRPKLSRSARSFINAYQPQEFWVLNETLCHEARLEGTVVRWEPLWNLPERMATLPSLGGPHPHD